MRVARAILGIGIAMALLAGVPSPASSATSAAALPLAPGVTAYFEMNEPPGTTVMHDSGPNGLDAPVDPTGVSSGVEFDGATGYIWVRRAPEAWPPSPERVIQVPDNPNLEPGNGPFTIELRYRTQENFGNITQKGQAQTKGGQWKIQAPGGIPSCLFKGSGGQVATGAKTPLNDEQWHDLTCVLTSTGVTMYVDGELRNRKNGPTGTIDNNFPMTIGGKIDCDQIDVTCDYFSGQIDYIKITEADNLAPTAGVLQVLLRADLRLRLVGLGRPRRQPDPLRLGLRRRADVDRGQPVAHLRRTGDLQRPAHGDRQPGGHRPREPVRHRRGHRADREPDRVRRVRRLGGQQQQPDGDRPCCGDTG